MLDNLDNGVLEVTGQTPASTATYACNDGFELVGDESIERVFMMDGGVKVHKPVDVRH